MVEWRSQCDTFSRVAFWCAYCKEINDRVNPPSSLNGIFRQEGLGGSSRI